MPGTAAISSRFSTASTVSIISTVRIIGLMTFANFETPKFYLMLGQEEKSKTTLALFNSKSE